MKQPLFILLLISSLQVFAQDCNNPLLSAFNFTGLDSPQSGKNLAYCSNLQNDQTCCSNATVSSFQSLLDSQTQGLYNLIAARDLYLASLEEKFLDRWSDLSDDINNSLDDIGERQFQRLPNRDQLQGQLDTFFNVSAALGNIRRNFYWNFRQYQLARDQCLKTVLEIQASIWCLACDPNYADNGVSSNGRIAFSDSLCQNISNACYPYLDASTEFNPVLRAREDYQQLLKLSSDLQGYAGYSDSDCYRRRSGSDTSINGDNYVPSFDNNYQPVSSQQSVFVPNGCNNTSCSWQCQNLFSNNVINQTLLANGAGLLGNNTQANSIRATDNQPNRPQANSQTSRTSNSNRASNRTWSPDLTGTGLNFSIRSDPGYVFWLLDDDNYRHRLERANRRAERRDALQDSSPEVYLSEEQGEGEIYFVN